MLGKRLWARVLRVDRASIEDVRFDERRVTTDEGETIEAAVIVSVRTPRVACKTHGVVAAVPWARHGSRFTKDFETRWLGSPPGCRAQRWRS